MTTREFPEHADPDAKFFPSWHQDLNIAKRHTPATWILGPALHTESVRERERERESEGGV